MLPSQIPLFLSLWCSFLQNVPLKAPRGQLSASFTSAIQPPSLVQPQQLQAHSLKNIPWIKSLKDARTLIAKEISRGAKLAHQWLTCESALYSVSRIQMFHYPHTKNRHIQGPECIMPNSTYQSRCTPYTTPSIFPIMPLHTVTKGGGRGFRQTASKETEVSLDSSSSHDYYTE